MRGVAAARRPAGKLLSCQKLAHCLLNEGKILGIDPRVTRPMTPDRGNGAKLRSRHLRDFAAIVLDLKIKVCLSRHHDGLGANRTQSPLEIAAIKLIGTDIRMLPCPQHGEQVVGVAGKAALPIDDKEILERGISQFASQLFAIERLGEAPSSINTCHGALATRGLSCEPPVLPGLVGRERRFHALEEDEVMR